MNHFAGLWWPDGDQITKNVRARLEAEEFYRADRFKEAMGHVTEFSGAIDCGAHIGAWTRELTKCFAQVVAFEANSETAWCARKNAPTATVLNMALGSVDGEVGIAAGKGSLDSEVVPGTELTMHRLDSAVDLTRPWGYVKVHVNGYELEVLRGAVELLKRHKPVLTVVLKPALENYGASPETVIGFLSALGYRLAGGQKPYRIFVPIYLGGA